MQTRRLLPFGLGFVLASLLFLSLTAWGQSETGRLSITSHHRVPLHIVLDLPAGADAATSDAATSGSMTVDLDVLLDIESMTMLSGTEALSTALSIAATPDAVDGATARVEVGVDSNPAVNTTILPAGSPATSGAIGGQSEIGQAARVTNIVDGDTIDVEINGETYRVRYILIDTPERGDAFYSEATEANRLLVAGKTVYLEKDVSETDRFGRLLRYVYLPDGTFVNAELVRQGYARLATFPPDVSKEAEIRAAQAEAVAAEVGLWGAEAEPSATANRNANLRAGPGTNYAIAGGVTAGDVLGVVATNAAGDWYQLNNRLWIAAFLVDNAPGDLPVSSAIPAPTPVPPTPVVEQAADTPVAASPTPVPPTPVPQPTPAPPQGDCDPSYPTVCIAPYPPDLNCGDIPYKRFQVLPPDPHGFDRDKDGVGCES